MEARVQPYSDPAGKSHRSCLLVLRARSRWPNRQANETYPANNPMMWKKIIMGFYLPCS
jgi:hypothetical protein